MADKILPTEEVRSIELNERNVQSPPPVVHRPRHFWEKLGWYNLTVLGLGSSIILLTIAFLSFFWIVSLKSPALDPQFYPKFWKDIVSAGFTTRAVTLCSILIRVATATQLGVFAAIMAALILERVGVRGEELPLVSMLRCINSGPHSLALSIFRSMFTLSIFPYALLVMLAVINAFAIQFTSTILLTDFGTQPIVLSSMNSLISFGISETDVESAVQPYAGNDYWKTGPATYNHFAEHIRSPAAAEATFYDTGKVYRGFVPFRSVVDREALRSYSGPMTVVDSRVICVKPTITNVTVYGGDDKNNEETPSILAMYSWKGSHPDIVDGDSFKTTVNCTIPTADWVSGKPYWPLALCNPQNWHARLRDGIKPENTTYSPTGYTTTHIVFNTTGTSKAWTAVSGDNALEPYNPTNTQWTGLRRGNVTLEAMVCFTNPQPANYLASVQKPIDNFGYIEITPSVNATTGLYDMSEVMTMFGANRQRSQSQRGLFEFQPVPNWPAAQWSVLHNETSNNFIWDTLVRYNAGTNDGELEDCSIFSDTAPVLQSVHRSTAALFQQMMQKTNNPALALQGLWTNLFTMAYYDFLPEYNLDGLARFEMTSDVELPTMSRALCVVLGLLGMHFALILISLVLFLTRTEMSLLGNAWQAVSQVMSTDTAEAVHRATNETDGELRGSLRRHGKAGGAIKITKSVTSGRTEATAVRHRSGAVYNAPGSP